MLALLFLAATVAFWTAFISAVMQPANRWSAIDKSKGGWIAGMIFLGIFLAIPYLVSVRPKLQAAALSNHMPSK